MTETQQAAIEALTPWECEPDCTDSQCQAIRSALALLRGAGEPNTQTRVQGLIAEERTRQDAQWGGPAHDDKHDLRVWINCIDLQCGRFKTGCDVEGTRLYMCTLDAHSRLVKIAALAVAGLESFDRIYGGDEPLPPQEGKPSGSKFEPGWFLETES